MKIAVVTPYYNESLDTIERCHRSVRAQTVTCQHWLIADGYSRPEIKSWSATTVDLPHEHGDNGNTPRGIGAIMALNSGYDAIAFLDADNWYREDHIATVVDLIRKSGAAVIFSDRQIVLATGAECALEDDDVVARTAVDTSCYTLTSRAASLIPVWAMTPKLLSPLCDRVMFAAVSRSQLPTAWTLEKTVFYESRWPSHYKALGLPPPPDAHHTPWDAIEENYSVGDLSDRLGYDPFSGRVPSYRTMCPRQVIPWK